ncbi:MAG: ParB/RepB/Spo0J family partition protein [Alphaproteobacteria bacterium GM202ARS2]|nr:ParB/RepB/Spo0J family partition protein [Alphaproteobacteria bacterium GM202ARS2]
MIQRTKKLGRGLNALLGDEGIQAIAALKKNRETTPTSEGEISEGGGQQQVPVHWLTPGAQQPRQQFNDESLSTLAESIVAHGILQPLLVRPLSTPPTPAAPARYEIVAGERRWRAAQKIGKHNVPIIITQLNDEQALQVGLIENLHREDLNPLEEALAYQKLMKDFNHTQETVGTIVGRSRSYITNSLRLLTLPEAVLQVVQESHLSAAHARLLVGLDEAEALAVQFIDNKLNVREAEELIRQFKNKGTAALKPNQTPSKDNDTLALEKDLSLMLGLRVTITPKKNGGTLLITYTTTQQLDSIITKLNPPSTK